MPAGLVKLARILAILAFVGLGSYIAFMEFAPRATITLAMATEPLEQTVTVTADKAITKSDSSTGAIPGTVLSTEVKTEKSGSATGKKQIGEKATATATLFNFWDSNPQPLAKDTILKSSDNVNFVTTAAATIPGATTTLKEGKVVTTPGKTTVTIQAEAAGEAANDKTGTFTIPSLPTVKQDRIYAEPTAATSGGTSKEVTIVSQADLDGLKTSAHDALLAEAKNVLNPLVKENRLLDNAFQLADLKEDFSAAVGDQTDTLTLKLSGKAEGVVFSDADLKEVAVAALRKAVPSGRALIVRTSDELSPSVQTLDAGAGKLTMQAKITTRTALQFDQEKYLNEVTGDSLSEADRILHEIPGVVDVHITSRPRWLGSLPRREDQITVKTEYQ